MKFLEYIFSIKNKGLKKVLTILGIKITFKNKYAQIRNGYEELFSITNNKIQKLYKEQAKDLQTANDNIKKVSENIDTANKKTIEYLIKKLRDDNYERLLADYKYNGCSVEIIKEFERLARSKHCWFVENNNLWLLYMQVMIENNQTKNLDNIVKKYIHFHNLKNVENFLAVANYFHAKDLTNENIEKTAKIYKKLKSSEGKFVELIKDKTIAVVGNGPVEIGLGHGEEIDNHDIVIRFNEFHTEGDYAKDYGTRTDVWINYSANPNFCNFDKNFDCRLILWIFDSFYFRENIALENLFSVINKEWDSFGIDTAKDVWNKYQYYYAPTTGFYLIIHLLHLKGSFKNIDFYGFKFLENQDNKNLHYYDNKTIDSLNYHNINAESVFLKSLFEEINDEQ